MNVNVWHLCDMDYFHGDFVVVVFWSLTAIATLNCHSMGKNSRKNAGCIQVLEGWKNMDRILILDELFVEILLSLPPHLPSQSLILFLSLAISSYVFHFIHCRFIVYISSFISTLSVTVIVWLVNLFIYSLIH